MRTHLFAYTDFEYVITEVAADDGRRGTGWGYTVGAGGSAVKAMLDDYLAAPLRGSPALQTDHATHAAGAFRRDVGAAHNV